MKIEIWSDFSCPYCYIGKRQLEQALALFPHAEEVKIEYKSYQLDPEALHLPGKSYLDILSERKGLPLEEVSKMSEEVKEQAREVGLEYSFDQIEYANTFDAHRLMKFGEAKGLASELTKRFLDAHFTESACLSDYETLTKLAVEVGMNEAEVSDVLTTGQYKRKVYEDIDIAKEMGVEGLPFFVFNEKYALSGVQPEAVLRQALTIVREEVAAQPTSKEKAKTTYCVGDECETR